MNKGNTYRNDPWRNIPHSQRPGAVISTRIVQDMGYGYTHKEWPKDPISLEKSGNWEILEDPQGYADRTGHMVIVDDTLCLEHHKDFGYTNRHDHYGGGPANGYYYLQDFKKDSQTVYEPTSILQRPANFPFYIRVPAADSDYRMHKDMRKSGPDPCMGCFRSGGRIWMLKGTGKKAKCKTKGMKKRRFSLTNLNSKLPL